MPYPITMKRLEVDHPLRNFLETTTVKGLPKACKTKSKLICAMWICALVFGMGVAGYFLKLSFESFFNYSLIWTFSQEDALPEDFPDITVCNNNPIANHHDADIYMDLNNGLPLPTYAKHPELVFELTASFPDNGWPETLNFVVHCEWASRTVTRDCSLNTSIHLYTSVYGYCFTFRAPSNMSGLDGFSAILYLDTAQGYHMSAVPVGVHSNILTKGAHITLHQGGTLLISA